MKFAIICVVLMLVGNTSTDSFAETQLSVEELKYFGLLQSGSRSFLQQYDDQLTEIEKEKIRDFLIVPLDITQDVKVLFHKALEIEPITERILIIPANRTLFLDHLIPETK